MTDELLIGIASVLVLGIVAQWIAWRLKLPSILVLLTFGFLAGPISGFLHVDRLLGDLLFPVVSLSVGVILFEGGLSLKFADIRTTGRVIRNLITVGAGVTWVLSSAAAYLILGLNVSLAVQLGAVLVVTGPTVIGPLLRHVRPSGQISSILRWEGILIDPVGATLAVLVFDAILIGDLQSAAGATIITVILTIVIGGVIGLLGAGVMVVFLRRYLIPDYLESTFTLMLVVAVFAASETLQSESGLLATTIMGIVLANQKLVTVRRIAEFKENVGVILISSLFILLAARLKLSDLQGIGWETLLFVAALMLVVRPASILLSTFRSGLNWREKLFLSWMAPRGIVAAATTSIFALRLEAVNHPQSELLIPVIFAVIVVTCTIYGLTSLPLARRLGLSQADPQGVLIVGAHEWARRIAEALRDAKHKVMLVDTNYTNVQAARMNGLDAVFGSATADVRADLKLDGIGRLLALTPNNEVNALAVMHFKAEFGSAEVYQLPFQSVNERRENVARDLRGRLLFSPDAHFAELSQRVAAGAVVKATPLTREFDYRAYQAMYGKNALPMFLIDPANRRLSIFAIDATLAPQPGQIIVSLVLPGSTMAQPQPETEQRVMA